MTRFATKGMDSEALWRKSLSSAVDAMQLADQLAIEHVSTLVKANWPRATHWTRVFVQYDDMPGGAWQLDEVARDKTGKVKTDVVRSALWSSNEGGEALEDVAEAIDQVLSDLWETGFADGDKAEVELS